MVQKKTCAAVCALAAACALVLGVVAMGTAVTLTFEFTDLDPHAGQTMFLRVVDAATFVEVARLRVPEIPAGAFQIDVSPLETGASYQVDYFIDGNGNGTYDAPPTDEARRFFLSDVQASGAINVVHDATLTDIDWPPFIDGVVSAGEYRHTMTDPMTGISVFWQNDATVLHVGLVSPGTGWVGIGFDPDVRMQGADILIAAVVDGVLTIRDQFGVAQTFHSPDAQQNVIQAAGTEMGGTTTVEFSLFLASGDPSDKPLLPGQTVAVILAMQQSDDSLTVRHTARTTISITLDGGL
jgi:uncharacterized protein (DUF2141 family)